MTTTIWGMLYHLMCCVCVCDISHAVMLAYLFLTALSGWWVASVVGWCWGSTVYEEENIVTLPLSLCLCYSLSLSLSVLPPSLRPSLSLSVSLFLSLSLSLSLSHRIFNREKIVIIGVHISNMFRKVVSVYWIFQRCYW